MSNETKAASGGEVTQEDRELAKAIAEAAQDFWVECGSYVCRPDEDDLAVLHRLIAAHRLASLAAKEAENQSLRQRVEELEAKEATLIDRGVETIREIQTEALRLRKALESGLRFGQIVGASKRRAQAALSATTVAAGKAEK